MDRITIKQIEDSFIQARRRSKSGKGQIQSGRPRPESPLSGGPTFSWVRSFDHMAAPFYPAEIYIISPYAPSPLQEKAKPTLN